MQDRINKLKIEVAELTDWMNKHKVKQVNYPLDEVSRKIIQDNMFRSTGTFGSVITANIWLEVKVYNGLNGGVYWIAAEEIL